jgi:sugar O-acyltransferase (sialic acid O-acetyltransferase NeuD family)
MSKPLVIFGLGEIAQLAYRYFTTDSAYDVIAFTADAAFVTAQLFCDRPVVAFDRLAEAYPPGRCELFIAVSYQGVNALRASRYDAAKAMGYALASYVSSRATVLNDHAIGDNCFILEDNTIQPFARIGNDVTLWSGNHVGHHAVIGDHAFVASHVVISGGVRIGERCFIGVNATLRDHIEVGARCVVGAGALLTEDAAPDGVYAATPSERSKVPSSRLRKL